MTALATETTLNPVADLRRVLIAGGYSPVPVLSGDKMPRLPGWQKLTPVTHDVERLIADYPDHQSTGLLTGELVAIDVDVLDEAASKAVVDLVATLPGYENALARQGQAPKTLFLFRATEARTKIATPEYIIAGKKAQVEVMGSGQQIVGFGDHPVTKKPYEWIGDSPLDVPFIDLPEITPAQIADFLVAAEAVLALYGTIKKRAAPARITTTGGGETFWQRVNTAALANLAAWVPAAFSQATEEAGTGAWRLSSAGLGRSLQEDISIHPSGCQDFGEEHSETPISLLHKWGSASSPKDAAHWLCQRLGISPEDFGWDSQPSAPASMAVPANDNDEPAVDEIDPPDFVLDTISLDALSHPGGLVEDLIDWIVSSAEQPSRTLALAAVLPLVAAVAGSRYSTGARDTRPNLYSVALAPSGYGKEHARSQIKRLLMESQGVLDKFGGPARIMSASALREVLEANSSVNCQIDEFGGFIRDITDRNAGGHQRAISTDLRDYYSASVTYFEGAAYRGSPPKRIYNPNLCIHGTSTPDQFWTALSSASAEDGLLPRLVLFLVDGEKPLTVKPERDVRWVPHWLLAKLADVAGIDVSASRMGNVGSRRSLGDVMGNSAPNRPKVVPWTPEALMLFDAIKSAVDDREEKALSEQQPFIRRILENAIKMALIVAIGVNPTDPLLTEANLEWGASVAWSCAATMLEQVSERLADNQREANYKRIAGIIRRAGSDGITLGRLVDRLKTIDTRQREEILKDLKVTGRVREMTKPTKGRPIVRLVSAEAA